MLAVLQLQCMAAHTYEKHSAVCTTDGNDANAIVTPGLLLLSEHDLHVARCTPCQLHSCLRPCQQEGIRGQNRL
jgi:hypothetical protein